VRVVRYRRTYDATNRLSLSAPEVRTHSQKRHAVEEGFRTRKSHLSLEACQAGSQRSTKDTPPLKEGAQAHHMALCLVAYLILERERLDRGLTWVLSALERVRKGA
jgi:hypothetical protein